SNRSVGIGVLLEYSYGNLLVNNTVMINWFGMLVDSSEGNDVRSNEVSDSEHGIHLSDSNHNTISENEVHDNEDGIHLHYSVNNSIDGNAAHSNVIGIYIRQSDDNVAKRNNVSINAVGIGVLASYGNRIYHNRLSGNTVQGYDDRDANQWDDGYPSAGNYWSDYAGVDLKWGPNQNLTGSDGIGDTPYVIDGDSQDRYPLMMPFVPSARPPVASGARLSGNGLENVTVEWLLSPDDGGGYYSVVEYEIYRGATYDSDGLSYELIASVANGTSAFTDTLAGEGEPNSYFYMVCAVDRDNRTACTQDQADKFTHPLAQGPNLISIPLVQSNESVETVLQTVEYDTAWYYDSFTQEWNWHMKDKTYSGGLSNLNHTMGVWVNVTEDSNLTVAGVVPAQTTIHLCSGWNLVSFPSFNASYTVADLKAETGATRVEGYDPAPPYFLRVLSDSDALLAGRAYWVKVQTDVVWVVAN
ncbi:MAG: NosD domain-containing protein, partial [Thermoplasmata archaeon]